MKSRFHIARFRNLKLGTTLATAIVVCLSGSAFAVNNLWTGTASSDWNTATNWSLGRVPTNANGATEGETFDDALINTVTPHFPVISGALVATPRDIAVGWGAGTDGRVDHGAGTAGSGPGNWMFVGRGGGTGVYNLADTSAAGAGVSGFAQGSGNLNIGGRLYVGWNTGSNGIVNVNTTGKLVIGNDLAVGSATGGVGLMNVDSGTITVGGWGFIGKSEGGEGSEGTLNMAGGSLATGGRTYVGHPGCTGSLNLSGGSYRNVNNQVFVVGGTAAENDFGTTGGTGHLAVTHADSVLQSVGELWIGNRSGTGTVDLSAGSITSDNWVVVGRDAGNGTADMTGGAWNKTGGGNFAIGYNGTGVFTQTAGDLSINNEFWVGQGGTGNGVYFFDGGTIKLSYYFAVGRDGGTGSFSMIGGTFTKTGGGHFIVGASGPGTMIQSGGLVDVQSGQTWMGEYNVCNYTLSDDGEFRTTQMLLASIAGSTSTVNLDGGTLKVGTFVGGAGNATANFNGTQIIATSAQTAFIANLDIANLGTGNLKINSNGFNLTASQVFTGTGGVVKSGIGTLTLNGGNTYSGDRTVNAGKLVLTTTSTGTGGCTVFDGAVLGVTQTGAALSLNPSNATFGTTGGSGLDINLGNIAGNPTAAPLNVTSTLTLNGPVTLNIADSMPALGTIPLVSYTAKAGTGSFVLGTLPDGVVATLVDNGNLVSLNVTSVALPRWVGNVDSTWDIATTKNWLDLVTNASSTYADPAPVLFDDNAGNPLVTLNVTVAPSKVTINNSNLGYILNGTGKITGAASLVKQGTASLSLFSPANDYTGSTTLEGGSTTVMVLADGGLPSAIGASSADPANLVLGGGTLSYTGPDTSSNRGFTITAANSGINNPHDLSLGGPVLTTVGNLIKTGAGNLILTNPGANVFGTASPGLRVNGGTLTLSGSGTQTNAVSGDLQIGALPNVPANLALDQTSLTAGAWIALGRGNGDSGTVSTLTAKDSTIASTNLSTGYDGGLALNDSDQVISLMNSNWTNNGVTYLAESLNSTTTMTVAGTSAYTAMAQFQMAFGTGSVVNVTIQDSASITKTGGHIAIGNSNNGVATMTVKDNGSLISTGNDFNIGDTGTSQGTLNIMDQATVESTGMVFTGKGSGTKGTINQTGGSFIGHHYIPIGRYTGAGGNAIGIVNISGGTFIQDSPDHILIVGEEGTGTLNVSATGAVVSKGNISIGHTGTGIGTVNLNGGTITATRIEDRGGSSTFNFNGGALIVAAGANPTLMAGIDTINVMAGGAFVDTNGQNVAIEGSLQDGDGGGGGLTKSGAGTLTLNGYHNHTGTTTVTAGTLSGTGDFIGPIVIQTGADLNPGSPGGTLAAASVTFETDSTLTVDLGPAADTLAAETLDISGAALVFNGTPTLPVYVLAGYTSLSGTFTSVPTLPENYTLDYAYTGNGGTEIAITRPMTSYESWAQSQITDLDPTADASAGGDPDGDGLSNITEFALDGNPLSGAATGKVVGKVANVGGSPALVLTLPVRTGATFSGTTEQISAEIDGVIYKIQGSNELATWDLAVSEVLAGDKTAIEAGMPGLSAGWTYRTFRSPGSVAGDPADFLRAGIETP